MRNSILVLFVLLLCSCGYRTYIHPSVQFKIDYPRSWEMQEGGNMGGQVVFLSDKKEVFQANVNLVLSPADITDMDVLSRLSIQQLKMILNQYELITQHRTKLGNLEAFELRGKYTASEGHRIIRTVVAVDNGNEFVFTFTAAADKEKNYTQIVNHMIESFHYDSKN